MSKATAARFLPRPQNQCQWSLNNFWSGTLGTHGIAWIYEIRPVLLAVVVLLNTEHIRQNIDSKVTDVATRTASKKELLHVTYLILIKYNHQTAKARALYKSTDGPAGQPADYQPNSDRLGDVCRTVPESTVRVNC